MNNLHRLIALLLAGAPTALLAGVYEITPLSETKQARVTINVESPSASFHMPAWAPGDYQTFDYGKKVEQVVFTLEGKTVDATYDGANSWTIVGGADRVQYAVNESRGNFSPNLRVSPDEMFVSGPGVLGWFQGHAEETHTLVIRGQEGWDVAISLYPTDGMYRPGSFAFDAENYDQLIDSPFVVSANLRTKEFVVDGRRLNVAAFNKPHAVDLDAYVEICSKAVGAAKELFGELPFSSYWFMFDFGGPGGGLEHKDSFRIGLGARANAQRSAGIIFHEYFHAYNVKRIRSRPFGPFDYAKPAVTGALWWLEGVTDYYSDVLLARAGLTTREEFLSSAARSYLSLHKNPVAFTISADECSRRVWETRGSQGFGGLSYYQKGWNVGMALDLAIRSETGGNKSLDDVMRRLYMETKDGPGFEEGRIREICFEIGGGRLADVYDAAVMRPGEIPISESLRAMGLALTDTTFVTDVTQSEQSQAIGRQWPFPPLR